MKKPVVFYDGNCPLCRREIEHYKRLDRAAKVEWLDIWQRPELLKAQGVEFSDAMKLLHTTDRQGDLQRGAYSFVVIWRELPYYRMLAVTVETLRLTSLLDVAYRCFARYRFRARCKEGCSLPDQ